MEVIKDMYEGAVMSVKTRGEICELQVTIGYLFELIMDELTDHIQEEIPSCILLSEGEDHKWGGNV